MFDFPITGGTISPTATAGTVQSAGGLNLVQKLPGEVKTEISLGNFCVDLAAKTASGRSELPTPTRVKNLNLGALGRSSIADVSLAGATVTADAATHTVSVQNASATLQPIAAEVLDAFRKVVEGGTVKALIEGGKSEKEAKEIAAAKVAGVHINAGDPLGTFSFSVTTN